jgi:hypothetical protein
MSNNRFTTVIISEVTLIRSTEKAGMYRDTEGNEFWIPWSQLREDSVGKDGHTGDIRIPLWLAEEKELDYEEED